MATAAQITANRANAQKSTGPRSAEGKAASRFNALKHGIDAQSVVLPGEDPAAYDSLAQSYYDSIRPGTPEERSLVDTMIHADWQKRRLQPVEAGLYRALMAEFPGEPLAAALLSESPTVRVLQRVQKQLAGFERAWFRAHTTLHRSRQKLQDADAAAFDLYLNAPPPAPRDLASFLPASSAPPIPASARPPSPTLIPQPASNPALRL
jgi:hypothetical protein